jgi:hypothetical protein
VELNKSLKLLCKSSEKATDRIGDIAANHISGKGLVSRIYKEHLQLNNNIRYPHIQMGKGHKQSPNDTGKASKHKKIANRKTNAK